MRFHPNRDVQIARGSAVPPRVSLSRHAQARTGLSARWNPHLNHLGFRELAVAMTGGTNILKPAFSIATRAGKAEFHGARHLRHAAGSIALRAHGGGVTNRAAAAAGVTGLLMHDVKTDLGSTDRFPKVDVQAILEIRAFLGSRGALVAPSAEELAENVAESAGVRIPGTALLIDEICKIEPTE